MRKTKVLFITRKWPPAVGGMETFSFELTRELHSKVDLAVKSLSGRKDGRPPTLLQMTLFIISTVFFLWRHRQKHDVVHFGDFVLFPLAWLHSIWSPSKARILMVHGLDLIYGNRSGLKPFIYRLFVGWTRNKKTVINRFISNSRYTASLCRQLGFDNVTAIPLGIRLDDEFQTSLPSETNKEKYVLFLGRLVRRKGARWFAEEVLPKLPEDVMFFVVGKPWDSDEVSSLESRPRVKMLGMVSQERLRELCAGAKAMVVPNLNNKKQMDVEGFGLVALDAAGNGVPALVSNIEGLKDAVIDQETGFLVEAENVDAWVFQLNKILSWDSEKRLQFNQLAFQKLKERFSWNRVAEDTVKVYEESLLK